ncbi:MAG TPA: thioredoxin family protein [Kiritimatiellia bacterium]|nr:thioredoxin family protein [Kiritimatiellia bacterium]
MNIRVVGMVGAIIAVVCAPSALVFGQGIWKDDFEQARATAQAGGRAMLLNFTGSDWCGWCIKLDKEVFSQREFKQYAKDHLVCVTLDFPQQKKLSSRLRQQNERLQQQYGVRGFPTIVLLGPDGTKLAQTGYKPGGAAAYVEHLRTLLEPHADKLAAPTSGGAGETPAEPRALRTWTSVSGSTVEARYEQRRGDHIELRRENGTMVRIDLDSLSEADQEFLRASKAIP